MAFTSIKLLKISTSEDQNGLQEVRRFRVYSNSSTDTPTDALYATVGSGGTAVSIPNYFATNPVRPTLRVTNRTSDYVPDAKMMFDVVVTYSIPQGSFDEPKPDGTNVRWNKQISVSGEPTTVTVNHTALGSACKTSAGQLFPADFPKEIYDEILVVSFNTDVVPADAIARCRGRVNRSPITLSLAQSGLNYTRTFAARTLKGGNATYEADLAATSGASWQVAIPLLYRSAKNPSNGDERGWAYAVTQQGTWYVDSTGTTIKNDDGPIRLLDQDGKITTPDAAQIYFFDIIEDANKNTESDQFLAMLAGFTS